MIGYDEQNAIVFLCKSCRAADREPGPRFCRPERFANRFCVRVFVFVFFCIIFLRLSLAQMMIKVSQAREGVEVGNGEIYEKNIHTFRPTR